LDALERLERDAHESKTLAARARSALCRASVRLRGELTQLEPRDADDYDDRRAAIAAAAAALEAELAAVRPHPQNEEGRCLTETIERVVQAIVTFEAHFDAGEIEFRGRAAERDAFLAQREREISERLSALDAAIARARRSSEEEAMRIEPEIASGVRRVRSLYASLMG
jgi:hypothetical protein